MGTGGAQKKQQAGGRAGFLNAEASAAAAESIRKEERALQQLIRQQLELGHVVIPPQPQKPRATPQEPENDEVDGVGRQAGPDGSAPTDIGPNLWSTLNPAYLPRPAGFVTSASAAYVYRGEEVEGERDARHHRRRNEHTAFADACLRSAALRRSAAARAPE